MYHFNSNFGKNQSVSPMHLGGIGLALSYSFLR